MNESNPHGRPADVTDWMRGDWEARAREDAEFYINTRWSEGFAFTLSGARDVAEILAPIQDELRPDMRVLEIGCGIGRLLRFLSVMFAEVHGLDIAPTMVERARQQLAGQGNVHVHLGSGRDLRGLPDEHFHVAFSSHVFQHIPDRSVIHDYVADTFRVLAPGGLFGFLVKTKPWEGQVQHDTWNGVELSQEDLDELLRQRPWRLRTTLQQGDDDSLVWVVLQKP